MAGLTYVKRLLKKINKSLFPMDILSKRVYNDAISCEN